MIRLVCWVLVWDKPYITLCTLPCVYMDPWHDFSEISWTAFLFKSQKSGLAKLTKKGLCVVLPKNFSSSNFSIHLIDCVLIGYIIWNLKFSLFHKVVDTIRDMVLLSSLSCMTLKSDTWILNFSWSRSVSDVILSLGSNMLVALKLWFQRHHNLFLFCNRASDWWARPSCYDNEKGWIGIGYNTFWIWIWEYWSAAGFCYHPSMLSNYIWSWNVRLHRGILQNTGCL